jgi:hypothetical protein
VEFVDAPLFAKSELAQTKCQTDFIDKRWDETQGSLMQTEDNVLEIALELAASEPAHRPEFFRLLK